MSTSSKGDSPEKEKGMIIMTIKTFKRYENKYLLNEEQYQAVMKCLLLYMKADEYSKNDSGYTIYNVYYDTPNDEIIRNSLAKPYYKEKLRLRSYRLPNSESDKVFLELKKKIGGVVSKRRATMQLCEAEMFIEAGIKPEGNSYINSQVIEEIAEFLSRHEITPRVFISYNRQAFFGIDNSEFRVTFDSNIQSRRNNPSLKNFGESKQLHNQPHVRLIEENQHLMEVKISGAIPIWLVDILSKQKIYSTSFSKYGTEYKKYRSELEHTEKQHQYISAYMPLVQGRVTIASRKGMQ